MQSNPLVSIIIPVHNGEKYLKESIESCLNQDYSPLEIIVVDDKSEDNTLEILSEYQKKSNILKVISVEKQNGLGNVINIGVKNSNGKYIARMDADDIMCPDRIKKQAEYMEKNPNCVAVGGQIDIIDEKSNNIGHREYALEDSRLKRNRFLFQPFAHPAVTLRKTAVESVGLYPENMWKVEDVKFFFLLSQKGEFHNLEDTVLKYRMTFDTQSQSKMLDHFKKTDEIRNWAIKELGIKPSKREYLIWKFESLGVNILSVLPPKMLMQVFEVVRKILK